MRLKLYRAVCVPDAISMIRSELGPEAIILSTRRIAEGVEVTAGLETGGGQEQTLPGDRLPRPNFEYHGLPFAITQRLIQHSQPPGGLADALAKILRFEFLSLGPGDPPLLVTGAPGAGKTACIIKLATRLVMGGLTPMVITADGQRAGAAEEMAAYTRLLGINLIVADTPARLKRALSPRTLENPVLVDTAGVNPFDGRQLEKVAALAGIAAANVVLVQPAGQDALESAEQAEVFAQQTGARFLLPTRLDMARRLGGTLASAVAGSLALTEAGIGPGAADGLSQLSPTFLADRLCRINPTLGERT